MMAVRTEAKTMLLCLQITCRSVAVVVLLAGCEPSKTQANQTRLVYLAPHLPCESGEPGFGNPDCYIARKRDALVVLRIPKNYGQDLKEVPVWLGGDLVLEAGKVLTGGEPGGLKEFVEKEKIGIKNYPDFNPQGIIYIGAPKWGWNFSSGGHESALQHMKSFSDHRINAPNEKLWNYVEIPTYFPNFKIYDQERCIGYALKYESIKGQISPKTTCDYRNQYLLPIDDTETYIVCAAPEYRDGKLYEGVNCVIHTSFELKKTNGKTFYAHYSYISGSTRIKDGHWKYIDQRLRDWIKSIDVTIQELPRNKL